MTDRQEHAGFLVEHLTGPAPAGVDAYVSWDPMLSLALVKGPGGFTQVQMSERKAEAIAQALGLPYFTEAR